MTEVAEVSEFSPALIAQFAEMVTVIPDVESSGAEGIIAAILNSTSLDDLDAPWTTKREIPVNRILFFSGIAKAPSEHAAGLPFYLVIDTFLPGSGEIKQYTCGAAPVVAQLVRAHCNNLFPFAGQIIEVESRRVPGQKSKHIELSKEDQKMMLDLIKERTKK